MYIYCLVDFENEPISEDFLNDLRFRKKIIDYAKLELEDLRQVDNVIKELLKLDDNFRYNKDVGIYPINFIQNYEKIELRHQDISFEIPKLKLDMLSQGFRILFVRECTIFVPILAAPKWIKGLIREKDFEMQICAPGFIVEDKNFQLDVLEFDSEPSQKLKQMPGGRLLVLYTLLSKINEI